MAAPSYKFPFGSGEFSAPRAPSGYFKIAVPPYGETVKTTGGAGTVTSVLCRWGKSRGILPLFVPAPD